MATRLHVGNLPYTVTEDDLRALFEQAGTVVSIELPKDRYTGRPRGFGFIEMESSGDADQAVEKFNGYNLGDRPLRVEAAREREPRGFGSSGGDQRGDYGARRGGRGGRPGGRERAA